MNNQGIIVVGMHRSGTSALSGELASLGVFMGKQLVRPQAGVNDKGFWENSQLLQINEQLLDYLISSWDDPVATSENATSLFEDAQQLQIGIDFIKHEYEKVNLWGMKDPRVSILLPYWKKVFDALGLQPGFLIMLRHPLEVAGSLAKRDQMSQQKALMLWLNYNFSSYMETKGKNVMVIDFSDLLLSPVSISQQIAQQFHLQLHDQQRNESFIDQKLKSQNLNFQDKPQQSKLYDLAENLYQALKVSDDAVILELHQQYQLYLEGLDLVLLEHIKLVKNSEVHFRTVFEQAYYSRFWKIFSGLTKIEKRFVD